MNRLSKYKSTIKHFLPYKIVMRGLTKSNNLFVDNYFKYISQDNRVKFDTECKFDSIISIDGLGCTGCSAVIDVLREYNTNEVIGGVDPGSLSKETVLNFEVEFLRVAGGLYEIDKYIGSTSGSINDALLHRVIAMLSKTEIYCKFPAIRPYFYEFFDNIAQIFTIHPKDRYFNLHLLDDGDKHIYYLKVMTKQEFRAICRNFIYTIFNIIFAGSTRKNLVLEQICGDNDFNMEFYRSFLPTVKSIVVYRDPRDVYRDAKLFGEDWMHHESPESFIEWYKYKLNTFNPVNIKGFLVVRFEDLLFDYQNQIQRIEDYLEIPSSCHSAPKSCFDPSVSKRNCFIWKNDREDKASYDKIQNELSELCYK